MGEKRTCFSDACRPHCARRAVEYILCEYRSCNSDRWGTRYFSWSTGCVQASQHTYMQRVLKRVMIILCRCMASYVPSKKTTRLPLTTSRLIDRRRAYQKRCPHSVTTGSFATSKHTVHSNFSSREFTFTDDDSFYSSPSSSSSSSRRPIIQCELNERMYAESLNRLPQSIV